MRRSAAGRVSHTVAGYPASDPAAATVTEPPPATQAPPPPAGRRRVPGAPGWLRVPSGGPARLRAIGRVGNPYRIALAIVLLVAFGLRVWGIKQGLPYSYNSDESAHFVPRAVSYFVHDDNPQYFLNPPAFGYLVHIVLELWYGSGDAVARSYAHSPTGVYVAGRLLAAALGTVAVWLTYLAGARLFDRAVGIVAAAILAVAFLPCFYSHLALNDGPTLAPVALALYGVAGVLRTGERRDYAIAAVGIGLAAATKYTGAFMLVCLVAAAGFHAGSARPELVVRRLLVAVVLALAVFVLANPYAVLDFSLFHHDVSRQQSLAAGAQPVKLGTTASSGTAFYLWVYTWGLGWIPSVAAVGGAAHLVWRRDWARAVVLVPAVIVFILYMGDQQRFFGRWLMPTFPVVVVLAAAGVVALVRWLHRERHVPVLAAGLLAGVALLGQGLATVIHDDTVLSRADTRNTTRDWMVAHVPAGSKIVVEPSVSSAWPTDTDPPVGSAGPTATGARWKLWNTSISDVTPQDSPLPAGQHRYVPLDQYERTLRPALLTRYEQAGYCWVVISSLQAGRSFAQPGIAPQALQYYAALGREASLRYHTSPFSSDERSVPFSFDWSINYYPSQFTRPGPEMSVYRLTGGRCAGG